MLNQTEYSIFDPNMDGIDLALKRMEHMLSHQKDLDIKKSIAVLIKSYIHNEIAVAWSGGRLIYLPISVQEQPVTLQLDSNEQE